MNVKNIEKLVRLIQQQQDINSSLITIAQDERIPTDLRLELSLKVTQSLDTVITPMLANIAEQLEVAKLQIEVDSFIDGRLP